MITRRVLMAATVLAITSGREAFAQGPPEAVSVNASKAIPDSTLVGVVYDLRNGKPLMGSSVGVFRFGRGNVTDSIGRFSFSVGGIPDSLVTLRIQNLGYRSVDIPVRIERRGGVGISVGLNPGPVLICPQGDFVLRPQDVVVYAHDILTGLAVRSPISLTVADSQKVDSVGQQPPVELYSWAHAGGHLHKGPLTITVRAEGYATWTRIGIKRDECGFPIGSPFHIWLTPIR